MRRKLGRLAAWLVTAGMLVYLFSRVPVHEVLEKVGQAAPWLVPATVLITLAVYVTDSFAIWKTFGWFVAPMSFRETLALRGATYLLALVNYALGQGAFVYFLNRTRGVKVMRAAAAVLLIMGINLLLLLMLTSLGLLLGARALPRAAHHHRRRVRRTGRLRDRARAPASLADQPSHPRRPAERRSGGTPEVHGGPRPTRRHPADPQPRRAAAPSASACRSCRRCSAIPSCCWWRCCPSRFRGWGPPRAQ